MSDRKNSQNSIFIKSPFISVVGTIQKRLLTELANSERAANGLAQSSIALLRGHRPHSCCSTNNVTADGEI